MNKSVFTYITTSNLNLRETVINNLTSHIKIETLEHKTITEPVCQDMEVIDLVQQAVQVVAGDGNY